MPFCQSNGIKMYYEWINREDGSKPVIVLITGLAGTVNGWKVGEFFQSLRRAKRYTILLFDNRGAGFTEAPVETYNIDQMAKDTIGLVNHLHLEKFHLYGVSMGGMIAQLVAYHIPDRLMSLTLSSTVPDSKFVLEKAKQTLENHRKGEYVDDWMVMSQFFMTSEQFEEFEPTLRKLYSDRLTNGYPIQSPHGYHNQLQAIKFMNPTVDVLPILAQYQIPTLILFGEKDRLMQREGSLLIQQQIPQAILKIYSNQGHSPLPLPIDDYIEFLDSIN